LVGPTTILGGGRWANRSTGGKDGGRSGLQAHERGGGVKKNKRKTNRGDPQNSKQQGPRGGEKDYQLWKSFGGGEGVNYLQKEKRKRTRNSAPKRGRGSQEQGDTSIGGRLGVHSEGAKTATTGGKNLVRGKPGGLEVGG